MIHCDLKPSNLLVHHPLGTPGPVESIQILLSDFGNCGGDTGTGEYMPPEVLRGGVKKTAKTDMWSLGVVLYFLSFGATLPWSVVDDFDVLKREVEDYQGLTFDQECKERVGKKILGLIERLMSLNIDARPSCGEIAKEFDILKGE